MGTFNFSAKPVETLSNDLDRLTILRYILDMSPVSNLLNLMSDLLADDLMSTDIQWAYHDLAGAILCAEPPRITGDHWKDFLIHILLDMPNAFSISAMKGYRDDALRNAMANDLSIMQRLFMLDDGIIRNWCTLRKPDLDTSNWGTFTSQDFYIVDGDGPLPSMRRMLLASENWASLVDSLYEMHTAHGAGVPLVYRWMNYSGHFTPIHTPNLSLADAPDPALVKAVADFEAGGRSQSPSAILLTGINPLEKARGALAASGLKIIRLTDTGQFEHLAEQIRFLRLRFAVVISLLHPYDPALVDILGEGLCMPPDNILPLVIYGQEDAGLASRFGIVI